MPRTISDIPFNRYPMESMQSDVKKPSGMDMKAATDKAMLDKPNTISRPRGRLGKVVANLPIKALVVP